MRILGWDDFLAEEAGNRRIAATVGVFDGLHRGHRLLVGRVLARSPGLQPAVFTFAENPKRLLRPASFHGELATRRQKLEGLEALGVELCVLIDFSGDFSKLAGRDFLTLMRDRGRTCYLAVGADFRCGHRLDTDSEALSRHCGELGIEAETLDPVEWNGHPVSSSRIRRSVLEGRLADAASMLGRPWEIDLRGAAPAKGFPGCYEAPPGIVLPPPGGYGAVDDEGRRLAGLAIGEGRVCFGDPREARPRLVSPLARDEETKR